MTSFRNLAAKVALLEANGDAMKQTIMKREKMSLAFLVLVLLAMVFSDEIGIRYSGALIIASTIVSIALVLPTNLWRLVKTSQATPIVIVAYAMMLFVGVQFLTA